MAAVSVVFGTKAVGQSPMETAIAVGLLAACVYVVNQQPDIDHVLNQAVYKSLCFFVGVLGLLTFLRPLAGDFVGDPFGLLLSGALMMAMAGGLWGFTSVLAWRERFIGWLNARTGATLNPHSSVHVLALLLAFAHVSLTFASFYASGGLEGIAQTLEGQTINPNSLLTDLGVFVLFALGGVGFYMRRNALETLERLGLRVPSMRDLRQGVGVAFVLYGVVIVMSVVWQTLVGAEAYEQQTIAVRALSQQYGASLGLGLFMALCAAIGEEMLFRGALQPVLGVLLTTVYFVALHTQYILTPSMLIIGVVALGFAWLRQRTNTTAAIVAHFCYNALPFVFLWLAGGAL
jgi:membrane protease YdiL (CAAX protease family)